MTQAEVHPAEQPDRKPEESATLDPLLVALVAVANLAPDTSISITLTVPGAVVSGQLICNQTWLNAVGESVGEAAGTGAETGLAELLVKWHEILDERLPEGETVGNTLPGMIHLRDAQFFTGSTAISQQSTFWRGRIDQVSGWFIGRFGS